MREERELTALGGVDSDGLLYLPEILYRRILNQAFGPGGWGMVPRGEMTVLKMMVSREWGLVAGGRYAALSWFGGAAKWRELTRLVLSEQTGLGREGRADVLQCRGTADCDGGMQEQRLDALLQGSRNRQRALVRRRSSHPLCPIRSLIKHHSQGSCVHPPLQDDPLPCRHDGACFDEEEVRLSELVSEVWATSLIPSLPPHPGSSVGERRATSLTTRLSKSSLDSRRELRPRRRAVIGGGGGGSVSRKAWLRRSRGFVLLRTSISRSFDGPRCLDENLGQEDQDANSVSKSGLGQVSCRTIKSLFLLLSSTLPKLSPISTSLTLVVLD